VVVDAEKKENEREKLFQVKRGKQKCAQKRFDRVSIVRDVRYRDLSGTNQNIPSLRDRKITARQNE
jgi:hypothetical protein